MREPIRILSDLHLGHPGSLLRSAAMLRPLLDGVEFKDVFIKARAREAISTPQYSHKLPVVSVRALNNHAMSHFGELQLELLEKLKKEEIGRQEAQFKVEEYWVGSLRNAAVDGDVEHGSLMAGQSVGMLKKKQPLRDILQEVVDQADAAVADVERMLG